MEQKIIPADPDLRRKWVTICLVLSVLGIGLIAYAQSYLKDLHGLAEQDVQLAFIKLERFTWIVCGAFAVGMTAFAVYLMALARRILAAGQFPPPGMKVIRDTHLVTGNQARRLAWGGIAGAVVLVVGAVLLDVMVYRLLKTLSPF